MSMSKSFLGKVALGTAAAILVASVVMKAMDEEHHYDAGALPEGFKDRKERFGKDGATHNWFPSNYFMNKDGLAIFWRSWLPTPTAHPHVKAIVVLSHGLGEHSGRYERLANLLREKGYAVYAMDHQGHGQSEGTRHYVKWFSDYIADLHQLTELAKKKHPGVEKVFLIGHSMGSLISIHAVHEAPSLYSGVVLSAPPLKVEGPPGAAAVLPVLSSLFPKMPSVPLDLATLSRDKSVVDRYFNDPLNNMGPNTMRLIHQLVEAIDKVKTFSDKFPLSYLLMHGTSDKMCLYEGSAEFHGATQIDDKTFVTYDGAFHELFNEPDAMETSIPETIAWIEARVGK